MGLGIDHGVAERITDRRFESWWRQFGRRVEGEEPHEIARRLRVKLKRTRVAERPRLLRKLWVGLLQDWRAYGVALLLLDHLKDVRLLHELARGLVPLPSLQSADEEAHLADLMRILAAADSTALLPPVECYLLERPIGRFWSTVPWALWPHRPGLFARAWRRYLLDLRPSDWNPPEVLECFLSEPEAVRVVRAAIVDEHPDGWNVVRDALLGEARQVGWLSDEQRESLDRAVL